MWGCRVLSLFSAYAIYTFYNTILFWFPTSLTIPFQLSLLASFSLSHSMSVLPRLSLPLPTFLSLRFVLSISPFKGRTFRERGRAQPLSVAQTFILFHILCLWKYCYYFLEMTCTFFCNNLSLLFPNTVPVFKRGTFWILAGWFRCSYSMFLEKSWLPLFPQSNKLLLCLFTMVSVPGGQESTSSKIYLPVYCMAHSRFSVNVWLEKMSFAYCLFLSNDVWLIYNAVLVSDV